jgi:hypothetical protein
MEMARFPRLGLVVAVGLIIGLIVGVSGCTAAPSSSPAVDDAHRQAQDALARWDSAAASGIAGSGFILVGEPTLMVGDDWGPNMDGGNAKMAWGAGLFTVADPLPSGAAQDATIKWQDGTTRTVPLISAGQALSDMKAAAGQPCPECTPLQITGAELTTATFQSNRGPVEAPAWEFSLQDTEVKLDQIAVESQIAAPAVPTPNDQATGQQSSSPWVGPQVDSATVDASGMTLTVSFIGAPDKGDKPCGADYTAEAVESDAAIVVIVYEHRNPLPATCSAVGAYRTAQVALAKPLGNRTLIDLQAQPITVTVSR